MPTPDQVLDAAQRQAVRRFLRRVGPALRRAHGRRPGVSAEQVKDAIAEVGLGPEHLEWACVLFCTETGHAAARQLHGFTGNYQSMRTQVAVMFFSGDRDFNPYDLTKAEGIGGRLKDSPVDLNKMIPIQHPDAPH